LRYLERNGEFGCHGRAHTGGGKQAAFVVQRQVEQLVHVAADEHVGVEQHDAGIPRQGKDGELGEALAETGVVFVPGVFVVVVVGLATSLRDGRLWWWLRPETWHALEGDISYGKGTEGFVGKGAGVEGYQGILGPHTAEGEVESQEAGQIKVVCDEAGPDCVKLTIAVLGWTNTGFTFV
jgi:hypothetical protein